MEVSLQIFSCFILCITLDSGQLVKFAPSFAKTSSVDGFTTTWKLSSNYRVNPLDRPRIPRQLPRGSDEVPSLPDSPEGRWFCEAEETYCIYRSSIEKNWLDASASCSAVGGMLPFWMGYDENVQLFSEETKQTSWSSLYWDAAGRGHEFSEDTYSPFYSAYLDVNDAVLRHIAQGEHWFALSPRSYGSHDPSHGMIIASSPYKALGHKRNSTLPFLCVTAQAKFSETQRKLRLPLKVVIDIEFQKIAGPDPGTEVLRCVPKFQHAYHYLKDRPFNIVWILDGDYYPTEGIKHGDHRTTITVPYKHFTKYACEVRYLGSFYGNRSREIEVATPSRGKLVLLVRIRNATFSTSSLDYARPIKELVDAINNETRAFNLSRVGRRLFEKKDSELLIATNLLSDIFQGKELKDTINFEKQIKSLNAFLSGSYTNQNVPSLTNNTREAIKYFENLIRNGTLVGVQFFAVNRCPLERSESYFWVGGLGEEVQPNVTGDQPAELCLDENNHRVTRTCKGSPVLGAQWVEPFSEEQNCSRAPELSMATFCRAENSLTTLGVEERPLGNLSWSETLLDRTTFSREGCVLEGGSLVQRTCIGDVYKGAYWGPAQAWNADGQLVNLSSNFVCASPSETTSLLWSITETHHNATDAFVELEQITSQWSPITVDVQLIALLFSNASRENTEFSPTNVEQTASIIQQVLNVDTETLASAQRLPNVSTNLLMGIEEILTSTTANESTLMTSALGGNTAELIGSLSFLFTANSSNLGKLNDTVANSCIIRNTSSTVTDNHQHDALVIVNVSSLMNRVYASRIAFVYHPNVRLAAAAVAAGETQAKVYSPNPLDGAHDLLRTAKYTANSAMVQVAVEGGSVYNLSEAVNIYFRPFREVNTSNSSNSIICVFWKPEVNNGHGGWSTQGCSYQGNVSGLVHCQCNHFSSFASFFAYDYYEPTSHDSILDTLTMIGCGLSLFGCFGVIVTYTFLPQWRKPKPGYYGHHVIFQLSLALALLLSTFLGGFERTSNALVCLIVAAILHYLILVVFCWMLVEAYCHYSLFLRVLGSMTSRFMLKAALFAWALPLIPVIALVVCSTELYYYTDGNKFCWLKPRGFYYALLPFASLIGLINLSLYILIIVKLGCAKQTIQSNQIKHAFTYHTAIVIFFVMGLSWVFGLLAIGQARTVFSYLFCTLNSLQGFAIFFHFIFRGTRAQKEWQSFIKSDREKAQDRTLDQAKHCKPSAKTRACCATSGTTSSSSTCTIHSRIIVELQNKQGLQRRIQYETAHL